MYGSGYSSSSSSSSSGSGSEIIKSGYKPEGSLASMGAAKLRTDFQDGLTLSPGDANENVINEYAKKEGEYRGYNAMLKRASKQKLNTARAVAQTYSTVWNHANAAAQQELNWQNTTARGLERMSETLLDLGTTQKSHEGFAVYCNTADRMITF